MTYNALSFRLAVLLPVLLLAGCTLFPPPQETGDEATEQEMSDDGSMMQDEQDDEEAMEGDDAADATSSASSSENDEGNADDATQDASSSSDEGEEESEDDAGVSAGAYLAYSDGVLGNGETKLLFFHAPWCPFCVANDALLHTLYDGEDFSRSTYKIDYDTATELRSRYGIVTQDTVVLVDGNGEKLESLIHPSESDFRTMLR